jgi:hypothetical protein
MSDFAQSVSDWETFYLLTGTAAATLIGLLFIAVSIHIEIFNRKPYSHLSHFAALTFNCFFYVLLISILFLIPNQTPLGLGIPFFLLGVLTTLNAILQRRASQKMQASGSGDNLASRFNVPILSLLGLTAIGILVILRYTQSLYGLVVVIIFLLGSASQNAWALLVTSDQSTVEQTKQVK